jgi:hypothetical protein
MENHTANALEEYSLDADDHLARPAFGRESVFEVTLSQVELEGLPLSGLRVLHGP